MKGLGKFKDLTGMMFGNWLVIEKCDEYYYDSKGRRRIQYLCECQCENRTRKIVYSGNLTTGKTMSCGCLKGNLISKAKERSNKYDLSGNFGRGFTQKGEEFLFDLEDYDLISKHCWYVDKDGYVLTRIRTQNKKSYLLSMHRLVMGLDYNDGYLVDHIGHDVSDNRKDNLRIVTEQENNMNRKKTEANTSGVVGVSFDKDNSKWVAYIKVNGKNHKIGRYVNFNDAVAARKSAEEKYFGEYSYDNSMKIYRNTQELNK